jgi:peptidoglycan-N-acetylglucosamine deacetylase
LLPAKYLRDPLRGGSGLAGKLPSMVDLRHARHWRIAALVCLAAVLVLLAGCGQEHTRAGSATPRSVVTHGPTAPASPTGSPGPTGSLSPTGPGSPGSPGSPRPPSPTGLLRIALTFDSNMTDAMLRELNTGKVRSYANVGVIDELQRSHTPATFFLAGKWVERYPDLTRRIAADPRFELASHSYAHLAFTPRCYHLGVLPTGQMAADVEHSFAVLARFGGRQTRYFRFPGGCYNARALRAITPAHCTVVQYDIVGDDPFNNDPTAIANNVLRNAHNGGIVVLHITQANAPRTADALPAIITGLRARGYQLVTVSELLAPRPQ